MLRLTRIALAICQLLGVALHWGVLVNCAGSCPSSSAPATDCSKESGKLPSPVPACTAAAGTTAVDVPAPTTGGSAGSPSLRRSSDPTCEPEIPASLAQAALVQAEALIRAHGDHVSEGELRVILPLLRMAAHSGNVAAQRRYGFYVFGYWATDEMFWPKEPVTAVDALAMLHVAAKTAPESFTADDLELALHFRFPQQGNTLVIPQAWVARARAAALEWERCRNKLLPP